MYDVCEKTVVSMVTALSVRLQHYMANSCQRMQLDARLCLPIAAQSVCCGDCCGLWTGVQLLHLLRSMAGHWHSTFERLKPHMLCCACRTHRPVCLLAALCCCAQQLAAALR